MKKMVVIGLTAVALLTTSAAVAFANTTKTETVTPQKAELLAKIEQEKQAAARYKKQMDDLYKAGKKSSGDLTKLFYQDCIDLIAKYTKQLNELK